MAYPYPSEAIANYFLDLADRDGIPLNPMKLQKLVYYAHGWNLAIRDRPLIDEPVQAWRWGPVIRSLYHQFKDFGAGPINRKATKVEFLGGLKLRLSTPSLDESDDPHDAKKLLERIWKVYGPFSGIQLSKMTHAEDSPWAKTWAQSKGEKHTTIPDSLIKEYFVAKARQNEQPAG